MPHIRLVLAYLIENTIYAVTIPNRGLGRVAVGILKSGKAALVILPISNRDIAAGGYPIISGWGLIRSPFAHSKCGKGALATFKNTLNAILLPENSGYWPGGSVFW